jgi:hypothetical protein
MGPRTIFAPMKKTLLLVGLLGFIFSARAQYVPGVASLVTLGVRGLSSKQAPQQKATLFVLPAAY